MSEKQTFEDKLTDLVNSSLCGLYWCDRVWSAWSYGTMTEDDFYPAEDDDNIGPELISNILAAHNSEIESLREDRDGYKKLSDELSEDIDEADKKIEALEAQIKQKNEAIESALWKLKALSIGLVDDDDETYEDLADIFHVLLPVRKSMSNNTEVEG